MNRLPFIILSLLLASLCAAQPTTQPTLGQLIDAQLAGKDAQLLSMQSQLLTAFAQITALRNAAVLQPAGTDLAAKLASAKDDAWIIATPGATYPRITTVSVRAARVHLVGWGNVLAIDAAPNASSGVSVEGAGFECSGFRISGTAVAFKVRSTGGGFYLHDIAADHQQEFCNIDAGADGGRIFNCKIVKTGGTNIFCSAQRLTIDGLVSGGSEGEQCIRIDGKPFRPAQIVITNCDLTNHNPAGKEVITVRECDGCIVSYTIIDGYCSTGQNDNSTINDCTGLRMLACSFKTLRPGGALVQCNAGTDALFDGCTIPGSATDAAFTISKRGSIQTRNTTIIGTQSKPLAFAFGGGTVQDVTPATQPSI